MKNHKNKLLFTILCKSLLYAENMPNFCVNFILIASFSDFEMWQHLQDLIGYRANFDNIAMPSFLWAICTSYAVYGVFKSLLKEIYRQRLVFIWTLLIFTSSLLNQFLNSITLIFKPSVSALRLKLLEKYFAKLFSEQ